MIFLIAIFALLSAWALFVAKVCPKGEYRGISYSRLPGIRTPRLLNSQEAWKAGHAAVTTYFEGLALYFGSAGALVFILALAKSTMDLGIFSAIVISVGCIVVLVALMKADSVAQSLQR